MALPSLHKIRVLSCLWFRRISTTALASYILICGAIAGIGAYEDRTAFFADYGFTTGYATHRDSPWDMVNLQLDTVNGHSLRGTLTYYVAHDDELSLLDHQTRIEIGLLTRHQFIIWPENANLSRDPDYHAKHSLRYAATEPVDFPLEAQYQTGNFFYPFEGYCVSLDNHVQIDGLVGGPQKYATIPDQMALSINLPNIYRKQNIDFVKEDGIPLKAPCQFQSPLKYKSAEDDYTPHGIAVYIDHPAWYKAYVLLLLGLVAVPMLLIPRASLDSVAMGVVAAFVAVGSVREMIFGNDLNIHFFDIVIGAILLITLVIPLVRHGWTEPRQRQ